MNEEKKQKKLFYIIIGIALTLVLGIGVSFAVFTAQANRNPNLVTTGTLQIRYTEGSTITANNLKPAYLDQVKEAYLDGSCVFEGDRQLGITTEKICAYKTFTITNIGSLTAYTTVMVEDVTNTYQNLKYQLFETTPDTLSGRGLLNTTELVNNIELLPNGNKTYTLLIWLDESATIETDQNKSYTAKITASAITTTNKNLDESGANAPVLADGMIPIAYKQCGEIDSPSYENYPECYNEVYENINDDDIAGLQTFCNSMEGSDPATCEYIINELVTNGALVVDGEVVLTLDDFISMYESSGYTMTTEKTKVLSLENYNTYVADSNNIDIPYQWYDYDNKQWANAVMVSSHTRDAYMNAAEGTTVKEEDILAYYVWIPRYKYQLFNVNFAQTSGQLINIEFERGIASTGNVRCSVSEIGVETCSNKANGNWYTHPAFTFGNEELQGIWVGKFETTYGTNIVGEPENTVYETPTIKPNITSLINQQVSKQFQTAQYFGTSAYLTSTGVNEVDAHMMKNIEWGAVAYLKQSAYGLGTTDIGINSNSNYLTGCGPQSAESEDGGIPCNAYHTALGMSASTTGNITGVYDMSGGSWEYVMGVIQDNTTTGRSPMSGNSTSYNSGYIGKVGSSYADSNNTLAFPNAKYYDLYANGETSSNQTAYNRSHLGDATGETRSWYGDEAYFTFAIVPWFGRGGYYGYGSNAGVFDFHGDNGNANTGNGFRVALSTTGV